MGKNNESAVVKDEDVFEVSKLIEQTGVNIYFNNACDYLNLGNKYMVRTEDACEIIQFALQKGIKVYLDGGWGVDALIGKETRVHNDIDLFVEVKSYHDYIRIIRQHGFEEVTMEYTTNNHTVWKDDKQRIIDLHCFAFSDDGILYDGDTFPSGTFSGKGKIGDITVSCIEPLSQVIFHLGYEHDENDVHDVLLLCEEFEIEIPDEYIET